MKQKEKKRDPKQNEIALKKGSLIKTNLIYRKAKVSSVLFLVSIQFHA